MIQVANGSVDSEGSGPIKKTPAFLVATYQRAADMMAPPPLPSGPSQIFRDTK
jgi:hypothetical protein